MPKMSDNHVTVIELAMIGGVILLVAWMTGMFS